ncbi:MAG: alpha/beta hydrolase family protein [Vicinamibacteria bacterium]
MRGLALSVAIVLSAGAASDLSFDYDAKAPLDVKEDRVTTRDGAQVRELTYLKLAGGSTGATLVTPTTPGRHPAVLFVHWYESEASNSNRTQFLDEAVGLAHAGAVSLLIDTMWSDTKWFFTRDPADDLKNSIGQVRELRRALDLLAARPEVDPTHIVYVGHDCGAMYGALLGTADGRPSAYVLIAGTSSFSDWFLLGRKLEGDAREAVVRDLAPLDPVRHVAAIAPRPVLLQFGTQDPYVPPAAADAFFSGARDPKEMRQYECGHPMNAAAAADRVAWLKAKLGLGSK